MGPDSDDLQKIEGSSFEAELAELAVPGNVTGEHQEVQVECEPPESLKDAFFKTVREIHLDESSALTSPDAAEWLANVVLGEKIAPGLYVVNISKVPRIHLLNVPKSETFRDLTAAQDALSRSLHDRQRLEGITPSKSAFRAVVLMLQKLPGMSAESVNKLNQIRKEARAIDLNKPQNTRWAHEVGIELDGKPLQVKISLVKNKLYERFIAKYAGADVPQDQRFHRYSYRVELSLENRTKTRALERVQHSGRRLVALSFIAAPTAAAGWLIGSTGLSAHVSSLFSSYPLASSAASVSTNFFPTVAVGLIAYVYLHQKFTNNRHR